MEDQNTQRLQADYDALLRALPPLPEPEDLYARIIRTCRQFWVSSKSVDNLGLWIRSMRTSQDSRQERYALYRLLVETVNRVRLELYLVRSQLATLWALPSLLIATHKVEPEVWRMMINRQQEDDDGKPLLVNNKQLEQAILDKLGILEDQCANLREYGDTLRQEDLQEDRHFRAQVLAELESLRCLISNFITHSAASESAEHRVDDDTDRMGAMKQQIYNQVDESEVIRNNEQFMEQLNQSDEEPPMENDLVMIDEEAQMDNESDTEVSNEEQDLYNEGDAEVRNGERGFDNQSDAEAGNGEQGSDNQSDAEGGNEEQGFDYERDAEIRNEEQGNGPDGEEGEIRNDAQDVGPRRPVQQVRDEIADLRQQLRQARQAMLDFRMMINELENRERSKEVPKSVHSVRFADIKVFAALGDSLSAGNGANARGPLGLLKEFRGLSFVGGDMTLEEHITIPNVLRKFNPNLFGYSTGTGKWNSWKVSKLNMAIPGSEAKDMPAQAQRLVDLMRQRNEINITNDWKLVNIFVGGNDVCRHCHELHTNRSLTNGPDAYKRNLIKAIQILKDNLPRTIVSLTGMINIEILQPVDRLKLFCVGLHFIYECHCEFHMKKTRQLCMDYMTVQQEIIDEGLFDSSDDFALVLQPFAKGINHPPLTKSGRANLQFVAPDCFHFSKYGHSNFAKHLWNNLVQPVGAKATSVDLSDVNAPLQCPSKDCPLFPTAKNSKNCTAYMTPSELDG